MPRYEITRLGAEAPLIVTSERTRADMDSVATELNSLVAEIQDSDVNENIKNYAINLQKEWTKFYTEVYDSWWATGSGSTWQKVNDWRDRIRDLRTKFKAAGGETATSESILKQPETPIRMEAPGWWGWALILGIGAWIAIEIMGQKTEGKKADIALLRAAEGKPKSHKKGSY